LKLALFAVSPSAAARRPARKAESQVCKAERLLLDRPAAQGFISADFCEAAELERSNSIDRIKAPLVNDEGVWINRFEAKAVQHCAGKP